VADVRTIPLHTRSGRLAAYALVDDADYPNVSKFRWYLSHGYAQRNVRAEGKRHTIKLHRQVLGLQTPRPLVDHINRNRLDCRRTNLRLANHQQNGFNRGPAPNSRTGLKGVQQMPSGRWRARINWNRRTIHIGIYATSEEAHEAYTNAARHLAGEFARAA
jgi:hypothetical protein